MRAGQSLVNIIRVGVTDFRLTIWGPFAVAENLRGWRRRSDRHEGVHAATMDKVLTRQDWSRKDWRGSVPVQCLAPSHRLQWQRCKSQDR